MASLSGLHLRSRLQKRLLMPRLRQIRLVVCDVDGVLTDGGLHYDEEGRVVKWASPDFKDKSIGVTP